MSINSFSGFGLISESCASIERTSEVGIPRVYLGLWNFSGCRGWGVEGEAKKHRLHLPSFKSDSIISNFPGLTQPPLQGGHSPSPAGILSLAPQP